MGFFDDVSRRVKHKAVEWDVQGKAEKVAAELDKVAHDAKRAQWQQAIVAAIDREFPGFASHVVA